MGWAEGPVPLQRVVRWRSACSSTVRWQIPPFRAPTRPVRTIECEGPRPEALPLRQLEHRSALERLERNPVSPKAWRIAPPRSGCWRPGRWHSLVAAPRRSRNRGSSEGHHQRTSRNTDGSGTAMTPFLLSLVVGPPNVPFHGMGRRPSPLAEDCWTAEAVVFSASAQLSSLISKSLATSNSS